MTDAANATRQRTWVDRTADALAAANCWLIGFALAGLLMSAGAALARLALSH